MMLCPACGGEGRILQDRYFAAPASKITEERLWYIADRQHGNLNVSVKLIPDLEGSIPFMSRDMAMQIAAKANQIAASHNHGEGDPDICGYRMPDSLGGEQ